MPRRRCSDNLTRHRAVRESCSLAKNGNARCSVWRWRCLKQGHFEWEDFRQHLIANIAAWEHEACDGTTRWDYYERYTMALIAILEQCGILKPGELATADNPRRSQVSKALRMSLRVGIYARIDRLRCGMCDF